MMEDSRAQEASSNMLVLGPHNRQFLIQGWASVGRLLVSKVRKTPQISDRVTRRESATLSIARIKVSSFEYCWMMLSSMFTRTLIRMKQVTK